MQTKSILASLLFALTILILLACSKSMDISTSNPPEPNNNPSIQTGTINGILTHAGQERSYILYVPASYTGKNEVPLVLNFHGYTSNAKDQMGYGDFRPIADTAQFIVVHPQGTLLNGKTHWNVGGWTLESKVDDVDFTKVLIEKIREEYKIDETRIYSTGMSNGGYMSFLLACQMSDKIAAVASVTGSMTPQTFGACDPKHPTPIIQIHGTKDDVVPYNGDNWTKPIADVMDYWVSYNSCDASASTTAITDTDTSDGSTAEKITYQSCKKDVLAIHYKIDGGGHTWPGSAVRFGSTNNDFNAAEIIWQFFSRYDLNGVRE